MRQRDKFMVLRRKGYRDCLQYYSPQLSTLTLHIADQTYQLNTCSNFQVLDGALFY